MIFQRFFDDPPLLRRAAAPTTAAISDDLYVSYMHVLRLCSTRPGCSMTAK
ncbi:hypothetical protein FHS81_003215 [Pseudochelatococcus contaminans]|uniref:Uncharacterized protein n=1 Tax=Pseudochelatococcus contaminans TaxID=1538103 RepID=A0A7W5Z6I0_9HYPH|nr:hypothetical protein [Pseudochelatococcus contaminans]